MTRLQQQNDLVAVALAALGDDYVNRLVGRKVSHTIDYGFRHAEIGREPTRHPDYPNAVPVWLDAEEGGRYFSAVVGIEVPTSDCRTSDFVQYVKRQLRGAAGRFKEVKLYDTTDTFEADFAEAMGFAPPAVAGGGE